LEHNIAMLAVTVTCCHTAFYALVKHTFDWENKLCYGITNKIPCVFSKALSTRIQAWMVHGRLDKQG